MLKDRAEAEEAVQDDYVKAFAAMNSFGGTSSLSTWLTRILLGTSNSMAYAFQKAIA